MGEVVYVSVGGGGLWAALTRITVCPNNLPPHLVPILLAVQCLPARPDLLGLALHQADINLATARPGV